MDAHLHFGLFVSMCLFLTQYFATHTHTHWGAVRSAECWCWQTARRETVAVSDIEIWGHCRVCAFSEEGKTEMNTNLHSSRRCIHTQTATWNCIYIQSHTHTHTQEVIHHRELTHSSAPRQTGCDAWDLLWTECLYFQTTALRGRKLRMYLHHWCRRNQENKVLVPIRDVCGWVAVLEGSAESGSTFARRAYFHYFEFMKEKDKN